MRRIKGAKVAIEYLTASRNASSTLSKEAKQRILEVFDTELTVTQVVDRIITQVRLNGDSAIRSLSSQFDGITLDVIELSSSEISKSLARVESDTVLALEKAAARIWAFQESAKPKAWSDPSKGYGELVIPLDRVGVYVPGGSAPLASTVLMTTVPARVAGVRDVVICTPPSYEDLPHPTLIAAAHVAEVDRVFKIGGAQAIAAMSYGTESVPSVDMVCGPGNAFVTEAKRQVFGSVGIDGLYGPTETLIVADHTADPEYCAADLLAQAEHDVMATPLLVVTSDQIADKVERAIERRLDKLPRRIIAGQAVRQNGLIVVIDTVLEAIDVANAFAPEHLCLVVDRASEYIPKVRSAGGLFIGDFSAEVIGDYVAGPSHVMPTGGTARFASALSVRNFVRNTPILNLDERNFVDLAPVASVLAREEGLDAHAEAASDRLRNMVGE